MLLTVITSLDLALLDDESLKVYKEPPDYLNIVVWGPFFIDFEDMCQENNVNNP